MKYKLYHGKDTFLSLELAKTHLDKIKKENANITVVTINADSSTPESIIDALSSPGLFVKERVILLKRTYKNKQKSEVTEKIIEILGETNSSDILIFWEDQKIKANTKYYKFFKKNNALEESTDLNKRTFFTWLRAELEKNDLKIDQSVIKELAERTNYNPERCANEIQKFKLSNEGKIITKEDVETLTADTLEKDIWDLIDAINHGDKETSIEILEKLSSQFTDPIYILSMLARNLRLITLTKHLVDQNVSSREISSLLKIPPFTTPSLIQASSQYTDQKIQALYTKLANLDHKIKTGKIDGSLGLTLICPYL